MSAPFTIIIDDKPLTDALSDLSAKVADMSRPLGEIGELMVLSTKERFGTSTGPDGVKWPGNARSTLEAYLRMQGGEHDKDGRFTGWKKGWLRQDGRTSAKAGAALANKKPNVRFGTLAMGIRYQVAGNSLEWGSNLPYSAVMQWGAAKGAFGANRRGNPIPWGNIPARPFLGLSSADRDSILGVLGRYLALS